ncbi:hypothetical protein GJ496_010911 [Pomphorhynchus laevis]|nr:hypothetical protein GJ496_010911 [Pomphorhynchus laevis]
MHSGLRLRQTKKPRILVDVVDAPELDVEYPYRWGATPHHLICFCLYFMLPLELRCCPYVGPWSDDLSVHQCTFTCG